MLKGRVDKLARDPGDLVTLVEAITLYPHGDRGMLALTGQHSSSATTGDGRAAAVRRGFQQRRPRRAPPCGVWRALLREMAAADPKYGEAIQRMLIESARRRACYSRRGTRRAWTSSA